jgi:hypothetical protein
MEPLTSQEPYQDQSSDQFIEINEEQEASLPQQENHQHNAEVDKHHEAEADQEQQDETNFQEGERVRGREEVDESEDENERPGTTQLIQEASARAIEEAIAMKRSDSILSDESEELSIDSEASPPVAIRLDREVSRASARYMEEASFEASLMSPNHHRLEPSGRRGRQTSSGSRDVINLALSSASDTLRVGHGSFTETEDDTRNNGSSGMERQPSERHAFRSLSISKALHSDDNNVGTPPLDTIVAASSEESDPPVEATSELAEILESCGLVAPPSHTTCSDDVSLLHAIFADFCIPSLDFESVERVLNMERGLDARSIILPVDVVIHKPSSVIKELLGPPLLQVPREYALGFFRILLRLLTSDNDEEYNRESLTTCAWYDEAYTSGSGPSGLQRPTSASSLKRQSSFSENSVNRGSAVRKADLVYTMVRLQRSWTGAVHQIYSLLENLLQDRRHDYLLPPVIRLLGLLCTGGVSPYELRHMLSLAAEAKTAPKAKLLLVRALTIAAEGASRSSLLVGKASPRHFFSFGFGAGIMRQISLHHSSWPFRNDFGMALWFRAEHFSEPSILLRVTDELGSGIDVSLVPLEKKSGDTATATVLAVSVLESGKVVQCIKANSCLLLPRVWYHVAVRHTRSRLKGVFSLSSREQISIMLDGKNMLTDTLAFPRVQESSAKSILSLLFGANFDGQTGALYLFQDNVSDQTYQALCEATAGTSGVVQRKASAHDEWDSRRGDIARKSKILDLGMRRNDAEDIVLSQRNGGKVTSPSAAVVDLEDEGETFESNPLSKAAFKNRLYLVWDPQRTEGDFALELHSGAHVRMEAENVQNWNVEGAQDVISSIGGVQALLPVFRSLLSGDIEKEWTGPMFDRAIMCSLIPDLLSLLTSFVREHNENAREVLRCGGIDIIEQLLQTNKLASENPRLPIRSLLESLAIFPGLSNMLMDSLLKLRSACSHYIGLETKVFSRLLFNLPLWFGGISSGISLYPTLLPLLSSVTMKNPEKVRDCVGIKDMIHMLKEFIEVEVSILLYAMPTYDFVCSCTFALYTG